jgi:Domain of unknown function (DUF4062)
MEKRYQVFVSSTYEDLREERQEVIQALLELDCIPAGMELFPAADDDQWTLIKKVIDDCDYYCVIVGGRYGSLSPSGISYTQMEYEYAVQQGKPVIGFIHRDPGQISAAKSEQTEEGRMKLQAFREIVQRKMCKFWSTPEELGSVMSRSLVKLIGSRPAVGWVRGNLVPDESSTREILRLRKQIDELEAELERTRFQAPYGSENLAQGEDGFDLHFVYSTARQEKLEGTRISRDVPAGQYSAYVVVTWNRIFSLISPLMMDEAKESQLKTNIDDYIRSQVLTTLREQHPDEKIKTINVIAEDFQTIKVQLRALGLITRSEKPRSVKDPATYWTLTPYGEATMTNLRAIKKVSSVEPAPQITAVQNLPIEASYLDFARNLG